MANSTWLGSGGTGVAGRPTGNRNPLQIQTDDERFALKVIEPDVRRAGSTRSWLPVGHRPIQAGTREGKNARFQLVPATRVSRAIVPSSMLCIASSTALARLHDPGYILSPGTTAAFVASLPQSVPPPAFPGERTSPLRPWAHGPSCPLIESTWQPNWRTSNLTLAGCPEPRRCGRSNRYPLQSCRSPSPVAAPRFRYWPA